MPITSLSSMSSTTSTAYFQLSVRKPFIWGLSMFIATLFSFPSRRRGIVNCESPLIRVFSPIVSGLLKEKIFFSFSLTFTTAAMWLLPFWNSLRISYKGISAGTLYQDCFLEREREKQRTKTLGKRIYLGILRMETELTGVSVSALTVRRLLTFVTKRKRWFRRTNERYKVIQVHTCFNWGSLNRPVEVRWCSLGFRNKQVYGYDHVQGFFQ